jgi:hypothetical protein
LCKLTQFSGYLHIARYALRRAVQRLGQLIANGGLEGLGIFTLVRLQVALANEGLNFRYV